MTLNIKPAEKNCYSCKFRKEVPGSCHSACGNKLAEAVGFNATIIIQNMGMLHAADSVTNKTIMKVVGNPHGIRNGWFMWPLDFDPCWLTECSLYEYSEQNSSNN